MLTVTTARDELTSSPPDGTLSLRAALASAVAGDTIVFSASVFAGTAPAIVLASTLGELAFQRAVTIDASAVAPGLIINGGSGTNRVISVSAGTTVTLKNLTITGGDGTGAIASNSGGAILNLGSLTLQRCSVRGNHASVHGGAIVSYSLFGASSLVLRDSVVEANSSDNHAAGIFNWADGGFPAVLFMENSAIVENMVSLPAAYVGGLYNYASNGTATATLENCTVSGNKGRHAAGLMNYAAGTGAQCLLTLRHCTVARNEANSLVGYGGGLWTLHVGSGAAASVTLADTMFADNSAVVAWDIYHQQGAIISSGHNLITDATSVVTTRGVGDQFGTEVAPLDAGIGPLGFYGGATRTVPLLPGSLARNTGASEGLTSDQRHYPHVGVPDIGAYEAGTWRDYSAYRIEAFPAGAAAAATAQTADFDNDGVTNGDEFTYATSPADPASRFVPQMLNSVPQGLRILVPTALDRTYRVESSSSLGSWAAVGADFAGTGGVRTMALPSSAQRGYFRVRAFVPGQ